MRTRVYAVDALRPLPPCSLPLSSSSSLLPRRATSPPTHRAMAHDACHVCAKWNDACKRARSRWAAAFLAWVVDFRFGSGVVCVPARKRTPHDGHRSAPFVFRGDLVWPSPAHPLPAATPCAACRFVSCPSVVFVVVVGCVHFGFDFRPSFACCWLVVECFRYRFSRSHSFVLCSSSLRLCSVPRSSVPRSLAPGHSVCTLPSIILAPSRCPCRAPAARLGISRGTSAQFVRVVMPLRWSRLLAVLSVPYNPR
ncbi:hypothetical protein AMAG_20627 [Allomyces macrogynus ATCC 38327]|uniref:Uncharacterized protein n=1 Tax=Allomyces macrogynus (strain ATCC 38327) TaxID=578462 RepID=A0A0L0TDI6_ALLM3|nr:hypothetical protein AMAG_20627 [Allomyces macrogynus ATCC 38327]|eukprot:KNE72741.1 hypothetical protein AMAG_20627 [Allomyces macrogynus ATCC 38327]